MEPFAINQFCVGPYLNSQVFLTFCTYKVRSWLELKYEYFLNLFIVFAVIIFSFNNLKKVHLNDNHNIIFFNPKLMDINGKVTANISL